MDLGLVFCLALLGMAIAAATFGIVGYLIERGRFD